jgi:NAD(P)-dependent dehydrogenase (short-subunit alcohol dehydrogenase family)
MALGRKLSVCCSERHSSRYETDQKVIAGSPHEPMTRSIAADLERRGFIVYVTVLSAEEEHIIQSENRSDIRALYVDLTTVSHFNLRHHTSTNFLETPPSPSGIHPSLNTIYTLISQPQYPIPGVQPHTCQLSGLILLPSLNYPTGPVPVIPPSSWADTVNTRLLTPILVTQLFLPLLTYRNTSSTILFLYPSISSSLSAPYAGPEVAVTRALSGFATSLRQELRLLQLSNGSPCNIDVVELKLGNIDLGTQYRGHGQVPGTDILAWSPQQRALYGPSYMSSIEQRPVASTGPSAIRGSPARNLHYAIFDSLAPSPKSIFGKRKRKRSVVYVGRGARSYGIIGDWVPSCLVGWMLGLGNPRHHLGVRSSDTSGSGNSSETGWEKV